MGSTELLVNESITLLPAITETLGRRRAVFSMLLTMFLSTRGALRFSITKLSNG
jgi:uncharacterized membrane protein YdfJ with MMPL/SSD domain